MKIIHFQRKPVSSRYFSIENSFDAARKEMIRAGADVEVHVCKHISQGLYPRMYNVWEAARKQKDVNHITGDVHYLNLLFSKKKCILTIHDCVFMQHPSRLARAVLKLFWLTLPARKAAYITCISEATKRELLQHIRFPEERIRIIPTVVQEEQFSYSSKVFNTACPVILHVGTTPNKNLERVAEALKGISCTLQVVGPLTEDQKVNLTLNGIHYVNESGISNERMARKYQEADLVLFVSTYEGFGMPILEAQLTGRPVITSAISPMDEVAGDAALKVNPFSTEEIRKGIISLISDKDLRDKLISKGRENVKRFSAQKVAQMYMELYREVNQQN